MRKVIVATALAVTLVIVATIWWSRDGSSSGDPQSTAALPHVVAVDIPALSGLAREGAGKFAAKCGACHGSNASGGPGGPPLVHKIYEPNHHADGAFVMAVRRGVRQHHWNFGNMPYVDGVSDNDLRAIIAYVRALQVANGIN